MDDLDIDIERAETQAAEEYNKRLNEDGSSSDTAVANEDVSRHPTHVFRWHTQQLQHTHTVGETDDSSSAVRAARRPLPNFGGGKPYPPPIPAEQHAYVVDFDGPHDPLHPFNWTFWTKFKTSLIAGAAALCSTFASSVFSAATHRIGSYFHVSTEVAALTSALYLLGYGVGPSIWAPFSELKGRKLPLVVSMFGFSIFAAASATAKDLQTLMLCRFFLGVFGSCPVSIVAAVYSDIYDPVHRGLALSVFVSCIFLGPMISPFIGGFTVTSYLGWRWDAYWSMIMGFAVFIPMLFIMDETYAPTILVAKADELRRRTKNWAIHAKQEEVEIDLRELVQKNFTRPARMFITEPIICLITLYLSFVYGLLYTFLTAYPVVFQGVHGMNPGVGGLPFFGMAAGMILSGVASYVYVEPAWRRKYHANNRVAVPEWRLPVAFVGAVIFTIGLFWFGWTGNYRSVHWIVPTLSGLFTGFGLIAIFSQLFMYLVDAYLMFAASAIAANTIVRSVVAAACPLFARQMFQNMGINWAGSLLGFISLALTPVPIAFYIYGARLRKRSHFAPTPAVLPPPPPPQVDQTPEIEQQGKQEEGEGFGRGAV